MTLEPQANSDLLLLMVVNNFPTTKPIVQPKEMAFFYPRILSKKNLTIKPNWKGNGAGRQALALLQINTNK